MRHLHHLGQTTETKSEILIICCAKPLVLVAVLSSIVCLWLYQQQLLHNEVVLICQTLIALALVDLKLESQQKMNT